MPRRTKEDYLKINGDLDRKIHWIGENVPQNVDTRTNYQCQVENCKNIWTATYSNVINKGSGCPSCFNRKRKEGQYRRITKKDYLKINKDLDRKIHWIGGDIPKTARMKTKYQCQVEYCKYEWEACYSSVVTNGTGCRRCSDRRNSENRKLKFEDYIKINEDLDRKIHWMGPLPENVDTHTRYQCQVEVCGHIWEACYDKVVNAERGCPECYKREWFKSKEDYLRINKDLDRKIHWIGGDIPKTVVIPTMYQCQVEDCKYEWEARYSDVMSQIRPTGCPRCSGRLPKTLGDYKVINTDEKRMIDFIGTTVPEKTIDLVEDGWLCKDKKCGLIWSSSYNAIYNTKTGCPNCSCFKSEKRCRKIFESLMEIKFKKDRPKFLEGLEYDGYNEKYKLAFEFNGEQHYKFTPFFHRNGEIDFKKQQERDRLKIKLSIENNIKLIIVPYTCDTYEKMELFIKRELYIRDLYFEMEYNEILKEYNEVIYI